MNSNMVFQYDLSDAGKYGFGGLKSDADPTNTLRYFLDDSRIGPYISQLPTPLADLIDIASAVSWADRMSARSRMYGSFIESMGWSRTFHLTLGVREPDLWASSAITTSLEDLLSWLSDDRWNLRFVKLKGIRRPSDVAVQSALFSPPENTNVVLFSGGLDSLAGVAQQLEASPTKNLLLLSAVSNRLSGVTSRLAEELKRVSSRIHYAPFPFYLVRPRFPFTHGQAEPKPREEKSQRTRGFLFLSFAAAAAAAYGSSDVMTLESGVGTINLPVSWSQLGANTSRSVHPKTLVEMSKLLRLIDIGNIRYSAPIQPMTKGELCQSLMRSDIKRLIRYTVSCDSFPLRFKPPEDGVELHCGTCTSCIFRRVALHAAGLEAEEPPTKYRVDVCRPQKRRQLAPLEPLKMLLDQVATIRENFKSEQPISRMLSTFPELLTASAAILEAPTAFGYSENASEDSIVADLCGIYWRYSREWETFVPVL